jgi:3-deoxy-D-manno-octulosonate 8-phosphate phosphatase (KDO 8-P phosphatase)
MDIDGTLTDGAIIYGSNNTESKAFSVKDGLILKIMFRFDIKLIFLTGRKSKVVSRRAADLDAVAI